MNNEWNGCAGPTVRTSRLAGCFLAGSLLLAGCGGGDTQGPSDGGTRQNLAPNAQSTHMLGDMSMNLFGGPKTNGGSDGQGLGVNAYVWRGALETLKFMPLASADPFGGVIITDWYQSPAAPGERFKVTAYILGRQLRADAIHISVFRQVLEDGQWLNAPVATGTGTELENKVLAAARELRAQSASNS